MKKVAVSLSVGTLPLRPQIDEIFKVLDSAGVDGIVILAGHAVLDPGGSAQATSLHLLMQDKVFLALAKEGTWSAGYLKGMQVALNNKVDYVISMDADGSHDPQDLVRIVSALSTRDVVMSSRFLPKAKNAYPLQRRVLSLVGTLLTKLFLTSYDLTDFTSGYEGIRSSALERIFSKYPSENWVSVTHGPYHLQNTEFRLALIDAGFNIHEIPIVYGKKRKGKKFGLGFLLEVALGFLALAKKRKNMKRVLKRGT